MRRPSIRNNDGGANVNMGIVDRMRGSSDVRRHRVMIFEPHGHGHHGPYLQWMATGLAERGMEVTVVTLAEEMAHPSMRALSAAGRSVGQGLLRIIASPSAGFSLRPQGGAARLASREWAYWRLFRAWYQQYAREVLPDLIFLPYVDYCLYALGLLGSPFGECAWTGLAMNPSFHYHHVGVLAPKPRLSGVKKALFFRMLNNRHMRRLLTVDEPLAQYLADRGVEKATFFPEPADLADLPDAVKAKNQLGLSRDRKTILVYGAISRRKGVFELLAAAADPAFPQLVDVVLAGKIPGDVGAELSRPIHCEMVARGRLKIFDRFVEAGEESLLYAAADMIWLGYQGHYNSSGILIQAAKARKPVIACRDGIIGWQTERHHLGRTLDPADTLAVIAAIDALLDASAETSETFDTSAGGEVWDPPSIVEAQDTLAESLLQSS
jgi:glycosyltransferase involved in cell wall biosynthesis